MDMTESIAPKSDQMNAEDLLSGPRTFTITDVRPGGSEQPVSVFVAEHPQPFKPSKTVRRLMVVAWGPDSEAYIGKRMTLYRDPGVRFGGQDVGGIRVSHMSGITKRLSIALAVTKGRRAQYEVEPLTEATAAKVPGPLDHLVWAMNAAGVERDPAARLAFCRGIVQRSIKSAADLTPAELADVMEALKSPPGAPAGPVTWDPEDGTRVDGEHRPPTEAERVAAVAEPRRGIHEPPDPGEPSDEELAAAYEREQEGRIDG